MAVETESWVMKPYGCDGWGYKGVDRTTCVDTEREEFKLALLESEKGVFL